MVGIDFSPLVLPRVCTGNRNMSKRESRDNGGVFSLPTTLSRCRGVGAHRFRAVVACGWSCAPAPDGMDEGRAKSEPARLERGCGTEDKNELSRHVSD